MENLSTKNDSDIKLLSIKTLINAKETSDINLETRLERFPSQMHQNFLEKSNESLKNLLKDFLFDSLFHVILKIIITPYIYLKLFLITFVIGTTSAASFLVIQSILSYFTYEVNTVSRTLYEVPTLFPKITFCNVNAVQNQYAFYLIQKGVWSLAQLTSDQKKMIGHNLSDILISCRFDNKPCDTSDFIWSFDDKYGNCYTFNSGLNSNGSRIVLKKSSIAGPDYGLQLTLYTNIYEELVSGKSLHGFGIVIRLGNSSFQIYNLNSGIFIPPGFVTYISIRRDIESILPRPYSNCEIDANTPKYLDDMDLYNLISQSDYEYTQQLCFSQCLQKRNILKYNCTFPFFLSLYTNVRRCNQNVSNLILQLNSFASNFISECSSSCPLECTQILFKTSSSSFQLNGNSEMIKTIRSNPNLASDFINRTLDSTMARESFAVINLFYDGLSYTLSRELPQMDLVSLLASIGGNLGLFLSISVYSICEMAGIAIEMIYYLIYRRSINN